MLLDSEGIDSVGSKGLDDHQIFTLTVLLASVLIYNSAGLPSRHDLDGLEYPFSHLTVKQYSDSEGAKWDVLCHFS